MRSFEEENKITHQKNKTQSSKDLANGKIKLYGRNYSCR